MRKLIACAALCGCASQGIPPGGPPDALAPKILSITPDTGRTGIKGGVAVFRFDEVVSEQPTAATTLGDLFVVSPRQGVPNVSWHREEIQVKPRRGWLPNTTYTVTMLPGIADLRGNVRNTGASTFFSTGPTLDQRAITGNVYDLLSGAPSAGAVVEARSGADTTISWIARADSVGSYRIAHLPRRPFVVRAYLDKNRNFGADPDEPWDSSSVAAATDSAAVDFFVLVRDSVAPRITTAIASDSVILAVSFDRPSDSATAVDPANYILTASDSTTVPIVSVLPAQRDSTRKRPAAGRAIPVASVTIKLGRPLVAKKQYRLRAVGIRGLLGQTLPSELSVTVTPPTPAITPGTRPPPPPNLPGGAVPIPIKRD